MEHSCPCACCRDHAPAPQGNEKIILFPGVWLFYLPEAAVAAAAKEADGALRVYACRRGALTFCPETGDAQSIRAGELAVWKEQSFLDGTITPDESYSGWMLRVDLKKLTELPPQSLCGADITGERLYDLYCTQQAPTIVQPEAELHAVLDMFYGRPASAALAWQRLGAQALLLHLGQTAAAETQAEAYSSEQVRVVHDVHAYLTQNLDTRVTIEELSRQYLMNPTTLKAVFKSVYGASLAAHMKEHRMGKAAQLLRETDDSVAEIARAVGYESQSKFTAAFKEYFGLLPKEYRRNH